MQPLFGFIPSPLFAVSWWELATIWMYLCTLCEHACPCAMGSEYWCRLFFSLSSRRYREEALGSTRSGPHVGLSVLFVCLCSWKTCWTSSASKKTQGFTALYVIEFQTVAVDLQQFYPKYLITNFKSSITIEDLKKAFFPSYCSLHFWKLLFPPLCFCTWFHSFSRQCLFFLFCEICSFSVCHYSNLSRM